MEIEKKSYIYLVYVSRLEDTWSGPAFKRTTILIDLKNQ